MVKSTKAARAKAKRADKKEQQFFAWSDTCVCKKGTTMMRCKCAAAPKESSSSASSEEEIPEGYQRGWYGPVPCEQ